MLAAERVLLYSLSIALGCCWSGKISRPPVTQETSAIRNVEHVVRGVRNPVRLT